MIVHLKVRFVISVENQDISSHCRRKKKKSHTTKKYVNVVISKRRGGDSQRRKFIDTKMKYDNVHCQLDNGRDISIISESTLKKKR